MNNGAFFKQDFYTEHRTPRAPVTPCIRELPPLITSGLDSGAGENAGRLWLIGYSYGFLMF